MRTKIQNLFSPLLCCCKFFTSKETKSDWHQFRSPEYWEHEETLLLAVTVTGYKYLKYFSPSPNDWVESLALVIWNVLIWRQHSRSSPVNFKWKWLNFNWVNAKWKWITCTFTELDCQFARQQVTTLLLGLNSDTILTIWHYSVVWNKYLF